MANILNQEQVQELDVLVDQLRAILSRLDEQSTQAHRISCFNDANSLLLLVPSKLNMIFAVNIAGVENDLLKSKLELIAQAIETVKQSVHHVKIGISRIYDGFIETTDEESWGTVDEDMSGILQAKISISALFTMLEDFDCKGWLLFKDILDALHHNVAILRRHCLVTIWEVTTQCPYRNLVIQAKLQMDINNEATLVMRKMKELVNTLLLYNQDVPNSWVSRLSQKEVEMLLIQLLNQICNVSEEIRDAVLPILDPTHNQPSR